MVKIIATIGPRSNNQETLKVLAERGVDYFRINLSHTAIEDIEARIIDIEEYNVPVILDTEGPQVRSGNIYDIEFRGGDVVKIYNTQHADCNEHSLFFTPPHITDSFQKGDKISLAFYSVLFEIDDDSHKKEGYVTARVIHGGEVGSRKAVHIESPNFSLPVFSDKDRRAFEIGNKYGIEHYTLSFTESPENILEFRSLCQGAVAYAKIESIKGLKNFKEIAEVADGILIDRGDLSSQVNVELIPLIQKNIINYCNAIGKNVFVATDTLQHMFENRRPNAADANDMVSTLLDGASGIALTKETATGKYPIETVDMLKKIIGVAERFGDERKIFTSGFLEEIVTKNNNL